MNAAIKIAEWVQNKPLILIRFDEVESEKLLNLRQWPEQFTRAFPHAFLQDLKLPTICLLEAKRHNGTECYLGTVTRKTAVTSFDSRLTIKKLKVIHPDSFQGLEDLVLDAGMKGLLNDRLPDEGTLERLSPKLSAYIVKLLAVFPDNQFAFETALSLLPGLRKLTNTSWAQENAIQSALDIFGIRGSAIAEQVRLKDGATSGLKFVGSRFYEDNVVHFDASNVPGFKKISAYMTGEAVFQLGDERLIIFTANKLPLEEMLGVDLIYINETKGNIVMVQYKMLEEYQQDTNHKDWLFRPDHQFHAEIARMRLPDSKGSPCDYRLNRNPFFFKFVKRKAVTDTHQSFFVSLDHLNQILASPTAKGPKDGVRLSYNTLDGTYLREADMLGLIRSGYIGTHRAETDALAILIEEVAKGNKAVVMAWQQKLQEDAQ